MRHGTSAPTIVLSYSVARLGVRSVKRSTHAQRNMICLCTARDDGNGCYVKRFFYVVHAYQCEMRDS